MRQGKPTRETHSDAQGRFVFHELPASAYVLKIEARALVRTSSRSTLKPPNPMPLTITLYPTVKRECNR